ncbi:hypothetical protein [Oligella sp. HMSC09E12]|uniref:hypothetical protein n=1 Tax=Oligella sp. HMSC09E12 TaxID=1581147 RepID=UPI0008A1C7A7|nr:hypothetical protein [Oligella sp. HMSC09E12]OFV51075.1 hypothetical protein HMPREF3179_01595 [Oligella sp. HMSC09E12]
MLTWQQWKEINRDKIQHIVGYEERFVDEILSHIPEITPADVFAQYHFKDNQEGNRYIDFMIKNDAKGYRLPIELDGYDKINNKGYARFNDFLERQNDLIQLFGMVLRYTNKKAFAEQEKVISEIRRALTAQAEHLITEQSKQEQVSLLIAEYEEKLAAFENELQERTLTKTTLPENKLIEAKEELARFKSEHNQELKRLQTEISSMKETQLQQLDSVKKEVKKQFKLLVGAVVVASLAVVLLVFFNSRGGIGASSAPAERLKQSTLASDAPTVSSTPKQGPLKASQARFHVGENQTVCGKIVHIHEFAQGLYLNLDKAYPHAPLTIVVWDKNPSLLQKARSFAGKTICVWGEIRQFNGQIQINLNSEKQLQ